MTAARRRADQKAAAEAVRAQVIAARKDVQVRMATTRVANRRAVRRCVDRGTTMVMTMTARIAGADHKPADLARDHAAPVGCPDLAARRSSAGCPADLAGVLLAPVGCPEWAVGQEMWTTASPIWSGGSQRSKANSARCAGSSAADQTPDAAARRAVSAVQLATAVRMVCGDLMVIADPKAVPTPIVAGQSFADRKREAPRVANPNDAGPTHVVPKVGLALKVGRVVKAADRMHAVLKVGRDPKVVLVRMDAQAVKVAGPTRGVPKVVVPKVVVPKAVVPKAVVPMAPAPVVVAFLEARLAGLDLMVLPAVKARRLELAAIAPSGKILRRTSRTISRSKQAVLRQ